MVRQSLQELKERLSQVRREKEVVDKSLYSYSRDWVSFVSIRKLIIEF